MKLQECAVIFDEFCNDENWKMSVRKFLLRANNATKWMIYSDYCLDDINKPNDVLTFVLMPYLNENEYQKVDIIIQQLQANDIKKIRSVNSKFLSYLRGLPIFSFSFVVNDRKLLFGKNGEERLNSVIKILNEFKTQYETWMKNATAEHPVEYYRVSIKKFEQIINEISVRKNIKLLQDIILIACLASLYASKILKELPSNIEIVGWFPDRDKSNEAHNNIITQMVDVLLYNHLPHDMWMKIVVSDPDSTKIPFYDNENRIADFICGTIADYDIDSNKVSKDKFSKVLEELCADNSCVKIYRIKCKEDPLKIGDVIIKREKNNE